MNRQQSILLATFVALFLAMYFGCDYVPKNHSTKEGKSVGSRESGANNKIIAFAKEKLTPEQKSSLMSMEQELQVTSSDTAKLNLLKKLSGAWYRLQNAAASGHYAEQVAEIEKTELAWKIAGSMYREGIQQNDDVQMRQTCTEKAVKAFENAISMSPSDIENQINLALCYTDNPPQDNPMKGILMLRDLDSKNPEQPKILFQLARLAMRTNQYEKAVARLEQILKKDAQNPDAICLIADAYKGAGDVAKSGAFAKKCESLMRK
jgi:tetratricopeptide (TPR) repeat protein